MYCPQWQDQLALLPSARVALQALLALQPADAGSQSCRLPSSRASMLEYAPKDLICANVQGPPTELRRVSARCKVTFQGTNTAAARYC